MSWSEEPGKYTQVRRPVGPNFSTLLDYGKRVRDQFFGVRPEYLNERETVTGPSGSVRCL